MENISSISSFYAVRKTFHVLRHDLKALFFILPLCVLSGVLDLVGLSILFVYLRIVLNGVPGFLAGVIPLLSQQELVVYGGVLVVFFIVVKNMIGILTNRLLNKYIFDASKSLSLAAYNYTLSQSYIDHLYAEQSDISSLLGGGVRRVYLAGVQPFVLMLRDFFIILMILGLLLVMDPLITIILSVIAVLFLGCNVLFFKNIIRKLALQQDDVVLATRKWLDYSLRSFLDIRLSGVNVFSSGYRDALERDRDFQCKSKTVDSIPVAQNEIVLSLSIVAVMVYLMHRGLDFSTIFPVFIVAGFAGLRILNLLNRIFASIKMITITVPLTERVLFLQDKVSQNPALKKIEGSAQDVIPDPEITFDRDIVVDGVSFSYPVQRFSDPSASRAVRDVSLTIPKGAFVGFVGRSGSGKTTLLGIILHLFLPDQGRVLVDGRVLDNDAKKKAFWSKIAYVSQNPVVLPESIRNNITYSFDGQDVDEDRLWDSIRKADLEELVQSFENGVDTVLSGDSASLSGGQKQRLVLARMFYTRPDIIVLDEATSALDNITENLIGRVLMTLRDEGATILCVAHRLSTIQNADIIFLLERGNLAGHGSFETLRQENSLFRKFVDLGAID